VYCRLSGDKGICQYEYLKSMVDINRTPWNRRNNSSVAGGDSQSAIIFELIILTSRQILTNPSFFFTTVVGLAFGDASRFMTPKHNIS
jgi:hypothetical protein